METIKQLGSLSIEETQFQDLAHCDSSGATHLWCGQLGLVMKETDSVTML